MRIVLIKIKLLIKELKNSETGKKTKKYHKLI